jgi:hypothetical protein
MRMKVGMRLHLRAKFALPNLVAAPGLKLRQRQNLIVERPIVPLFPRDQTKPALTMSLTSHWSTRLRRTGRPAPPCRCHIAPAKSKSRMPGPCVAAIDGIAATDTRLGCMEQRPPLAAALAQDLLPEQAGA